MPTLFIFLLKVNIALIIFCMGYYLVLRRLTFYTLNRIYLVAAIIFASVYPLIDLSAFANRHQQITQPVQTVVIMWKAPIQQITQPITTQTNYWHWIVLLFWAGVILLAMRLVVQFVSLYRLYRSSVADTINGQPVRIISKNIGPFSFWQSIYVNPDALTAADMENVLQHEQIHIKNWHTLDVLLAELSIIFYWFNPGIWFIKKAICENLEFITDRKVLQKGADSKQYQYSLLNVNFIANASPGLTNHFNLSTLKKRIIMMNKKASSNFNLTRYVLLIPAVIVLLLIFSFSKAELVSKSAHALNKLAGKVSQSPIITTLKEAAITATKTSKINKLADTVKPNVTRAKINKPAIEITATPTVTDIPKEAMVQTANDRKNNYVIDGIKIIPGEKQTAIANGLIRSIYIISPEDAATVSYKFTNSNKITFIFTNNTAENDSLEKSIRKLSSVNKTNITKGGLTSIISGAATNGLSAQTQLPTPIVTAFTLHNSLNNNGFSGKAKSMKSIDFAFQNTSSITFKKENEPSVTTIATDSVVSKGEFINLYGKAKLFYKDQIIEADYIQYNKETKKGFAKGKVTITGKGSDDITTTASDATFTLDH